MQNKKAFYITVGLVFIILAFFILRIVILNKIISKVTNKLNDQYHLQLTIADYEFKGLKSLQFQNILLKKRENDTVLYSENLFVQMRLWNLFSREWRIRKIHIENTILNLNNRLIDSLLLTINKDTQSKKNDLKQSYSNRFNKIFDKLFSFVPSEIILNNIYINYSREKIGYTARCSEFILQNNKFRGNLFFSDSALHSACVISGKVSRPAKQISFSIKNVDNKLVEIPFLNRRWGLKLQFDSLLFGIYKNKNSSDNFSFGGFFEANNVVLYHKGLAPTAVKTNYGSCYFTATAGNNFIEMDSSSKVTINNFSFSPWIFFKNNEHHTLHLKVLPKEFEANNIIESFPDGLFTSIRDMRLKGKLTYSLDLNIDCDNPDSIFLNSTLKSKDLQILKYGAVPLTLLNDTFDQYIIDNGDTLKSILTGPLNPDFVCLNEISDYLKNSVLTSEDGSFFYHKGFNEEAIANSISENIKQGRFARGGSTITMQLIKNVFLNQNKTISRKLEELFIVWLIENLHLVTKERMFEVYLNIIEWGPGVYGIKPASEFYFKKNPSQLSLSESMYLASVIPTPKFFKYTFTKEGSLKSFYKEYFQQLTTIMLSRNQLVAEDTIGLIPVIELTGIAKDLLHESDTICIDSLLIDNPEIIEEMLSLAYFSP